MPSRPLVGLFAPRSPLRVTPLVVVPMTGSAASPLPPDPFTMALRMCDDDGMVSHERGVLSNSNLTLLDAHNNMRMQTRPGCDLITEPFHCTGSAHLAGEHIRCTSPAHRANRVAQELERDTK